MPSEVLSRPPVEQPGRRRWLQLGIVCASVLVTFMGASAILPYLPLVLQEEGSSLAMIGVVVAAFSLGTLFFSSPLGWLSDTIGRKPIMIASMALLTVVSLLFTRSADPRWFVVFRLLEGVSAAASGVMFAYAADISAPAQRSRSLGLVMSAASGGGFAGPALGAALYHLGGGERAGFHAIFYFVAALAAVNTIVIVLLIREPEATGRRSGSRGTKGRRPGYRAILRPTIVGLLVVGFTANIAYGGFQAVWSIWLEHLGASTALISIMWIAVSLPMMLSFVGGVLADRYNRLILTFGGYAVASLGFVVFGLMEGFGLFLAVSIVQGLAYAVCAPAKQGSIIQASPAEWIGTVQGLDVTSMQLGGVLGTLLAPVIYGAISGYVLVVCGAVGLAGLVFAAPILWRESGRGDRAIERANSRLPGGGLE